VHTELLKKSEVEEKILREVPDVFDKWFEETLARNLAFQSGHPKKMMGCTWSYINLNGHISLGSTGLLGGITNPNS